jgi:hypothetical protein
VLHTSSKGKQESEIRSISATVSLILSVALDPWFLSHHRAASVTVPVARTAGARCRRYQLVSPLTGRCLADWVGR